MKFWASLFHKFDKNNFLPEILASKHNQDFLLGVLRQDLPTSEQNLRDANAIVTHSKTKNYSVWAKEAWHQFGGDLNKLMVDKLTSEEVSFYRGRMSSTMDLLRLSYIAKNSQEERSKEKTTNI